jgi:hypothetical protein
MVSPAARFDCAWTTCPTVRSVVSYWFARARKGGPGRRTPVRWGRCLGRCGGGVARRFWPQSRRGSSAGGGSPSRGARGCARKVGGTSTKEKGGKSAWVHDAPRLTAGGTPASSTRVVNGQKGAVLPRLVCACACVGARARGCVQWSVRRTPTSRPRWWPERRRGTAPGRKDRKS